MARHLCCISDFTHGWPDQIVDRRLFKFHAESIHAGDCSDGVEAGVIHEFSPSDKPDVLIQFTDDIIGFLQISEKFFGGCKCGVR